MSIKKNQGRWFEERGVAVILASLAMLISAPLLVYATDSSTGDFSTALSQISRSISDLKSQVLGLSSKLDTYNSKLDSLNSRVETLALSNTDSNVMAPGVSECLAGCRKTTATCISARPAIGSPETNALRAPSSNASTRSSCITQSASCINNCRPSNTSVSCDTNCAVQLGACVSGSGSDISAIQSCRAANETCLTSNCTPRAVTVGDLQASVTLVLPPGTCQSQCTLDYSVCRQNARFDQVALDECGKIRQTCAQIACQGPTRAGTPTITPTGGVKIPRNIECENTCTDTYYKCKQNAGDNQDQTATCGNSYGTCRNQCLIQGGGGWSGRE